MGLPEEEEPSYPTTSTTAKSTLPTLLESPTNNGTIIKHTTTTIVKTEHHEDNINYSIDTKSKIQNHPGNKDHLMYANDITTTHPNIEHKRTQQLFYENDDSIQSSSHFSSTSPTSNHLQQRDACRLDKDEIPSSFTSSTATLNNRGIDDNNKVPKNPRNTTHYNSWHYKDMICAIKAVQSKALSMTAAAKQYGIPRTTLRHYLNDGTNKEAKRVGFFLTKEHELILVDYAIQQGDLPEKQLYKCIFDKAKELHQTTLSPPSPKSCSSSPPTMVLSISGNTTKNDATTANALMNNEYIDVHTNISTISTENNDKGKVSKDKSARRNQPTPAWIRRFVYRQKQLHHLFPTLFNKYEHPLHGGRKTTTTTTKVSNTQQQQQQQQQQQLHQRQKSGSNSSSRATENSSNGNEDDDDDDHFDMMMPMDEDAREDFDDAADVADRMISIGNDGVETRGSVFATSASMINTVKRSNSNDEEILFSLSAKTPSHQSSYENNINQNNGTPVQENINALQTNTTGDGFHSSVGSRYPKQQQHDKRRKNSKEQQRTTLLSLEKIGGPIFKKQYQQQCGNLSSLDRRDDTFRYDHHQQESQHQQSPFSCHTISYPSQLDADYFVPSGEKYKHSQNIKSREVNRNFSKNWPVKSNSSVLVSPNNNNVNSKHVNNNNIIKKNNNNNKNSVMLTSSLPSFTSTNSKSLPTSRIIDAEMEQQGNSYNNSRQPRLIPLSYERFNNNDNYSRSRTFDRFQPSNSQSIRPKHHKYYKYNHHYKTALVSTPTEIKSYILPHHQHRRQHSFETNEHDMQSTIRRQPSLESSEEYVAIIHAEPSSFEEASPPQHHHQQPETNDEIRRRRTSIFFNYMAMLSPPNIKSPIDGSTATDTTQHRNETCGSSSPYRSRRGEEQRSLTPTPPIKTTVSSIFHDNKIVSRHQDKDKVVETFDGINRRNERKNSLSYTNNTNNTNCDKDKDRTTTHQRQAEEMRIMSRTLATMETELGNDYVQLFKERFAKNENLERLYCQWMNLRSGIDRLVLIGNDIGDNVSDSIGCDQENVKMENPL